MAFKHQVHNGISTIYSLSPNGPQKGSRVLMYHSIEQNVSDDPKGMFTISLEKLKSQLGFLKNYNVVPFGAPSGRSGDISITFDDGYKNNLSLAAEVLVEKGYPFTVFVIAEKVINGDSEYLSKTELQQLSKIPGVTIGTHGWSHKKLAELESFKIIEELSTSKKSIEDIIGSPVEVLSYPHGSTNRAVSEIAKQVGYKFGGTSFVGANLQSRDPLLQKRLPIMASDSQSLFKHKIAGCWDWYSWTQQDPCEAGAYGN